MDEKEGAGVDANVGVDPFCDGDGPLSGVAPVLLGWVVVAVVCVTPAVQVVSFAIMVGFGGGLTMQVVGKWGVHAEEEGAVDHEREANESGAMSFICVGAFWCDECDVKAASFKVALRLGREVVCLARPKGGESEVVSSSVVVVKG